MSDDAHVRVAFLKGINVGGHRLTMDELRAALAPVGLRDLQTFIASGNVMFAADSRDEAALESEVGDTLRSALGYEVETFVRDVPALAPLIDYVESRRPDAEWKPHVLFTREPASDAVRDNLSGLETADDTFHFFGREVVWMRRGGLSDSSIKMHHLDKAMERRPATARTLRTVQRIAAKFA